MKPKNDIVLFPKSAPGELGEQQDQKPPEGLFFVPRPDRPKPFVARWREANGEMRSQAFKTEKERWEFAEYWEKERIDKGKAMPVVPAAEALKWLTFSQITENADPLEVARFWAKYRGRRGGEMELETARTNFLNLRADLKVGGDAKSHMKLHLSRLVKALGEKKKLKEIEAEDLRRALKGLTDPETGEALSTVTKRHHLKSWRCFFDRAVDEKWMDESPAKIVEAPQDESEVRDEDGSASTESVNIMTVEQAEIFFRVNRDCLVIGRLALEAFAGLRYTSAARIKRTSLRWEEKGIVLPGRQHKSGNRHYIDGWPENLFKWLKHAPDACWDVSRRSYLDLKREAFERAGLKPESPANGVNWSEDELAQFEDMKNVFRHSFASFHLAAFKQPQLTLYLMSKRNLASLNNDYRGMATESEGKRYFSIEP